MLFSTFLLLLLFLINGLYSSCKYLFQTNVWTIKSILKAPNISSFFRLNYFTRHITDTFRHRTLLLIYYFHLVKNRQTAAVLFLTLMELFSNQILGNRHSFVNHLRVQRLEEWEASIFFGKLLPNLFL